MAAIAASRARRPAGLMETRLRRASSQSGPHVDVPRPFQTVERVRHRPARDVKDPRKLCRCLFPRSTRASWFSTEKMAELHPLGQRLAQPVPGQLVGHEHLAEQGDRQRIFGARRIIRARR